MAGHTSIGSNLDKNRRFGAAAREGAWASRVKGASTGFRSWIWRIAGKHDPLTSARPGGWRCRNQRPCVGVLRRDEQIIGVPQFDHTPEIHYRDALADLTHHAQIVAN